MKGVCMVGSMRGYSIGIVVYTRYHFRTFPAIEFCQLYSCSFTTSATEKVYDEHGIIRTSPDVLQFFF